MCDTCAAHAHEHTHGDEHHDHGLPQNARGDDFRVVVTGKGGVGKTTLTALLARRMSRRGYRVLALDADPQMNLPYALGLESAEAHSLVPLSENIDYVEEKTGARPGRGLGSVLPAQSRCRRCRRPLRRARTGRRATAGHGQYGAAGRRLPVPRERTAGLGGECDEPEARRGDPHGYAGRLRTFRAGAGQRVPACGRCQ